MVVGSTAYGNGAASISGTCSISSTIASNKVISEVPLRIDSDLVAVDDKLSVKGAYANIATMYIQGQKVNSTNSGKFYLNDIDVSETNSIEVQFITSEGEVFTKEFDIKKGTLDGEGNINIIPVITASDITVCVGTPLDIMKDVKATDEEDGDLTSAVTADPASINTDSVGEHEVTYSVTDSKGAISTKTITINIEEHDWGDWETTKEPGYTEEGEKQRTCSRCNGTETEAIPKLDMKITKQPKNVETSVGGKVEISVEAEGADPTYQWQTQISGSSTWSNTSLSGSTTPTMSFKPGVNLNGRKYRCLITDKYGVKLYTNEVTLTVVDGPTITSQPKDVATSVGGKVSISVEATGSDLTYQWQTQVSGSSAWSNTSLNGSKTPAMSFKPGTNLNGRKYRCVITDKYGVKVYSNAVTLTVVAGPTITVQPTNVQTSLGGKVEISVKATGADLTYQWQTQVSGSSTWSNTSLSGSTTPTMSFKPGTNLNGRKYRCVITDKYSVKVNTNAVTLTIVSGPTITKQPKDVTANIGDKVTISVEATGADLTYQWQTQVSRSSAWSNTSLNGSKTAAMSFKPGTNLNDRKYRCVITDVYGVKIYTNAVTLTVTNGVIKITAQPKNVTASVGEKVEIRVTATGGQGALTYQWQTQVSGSSAWGNTSLNGSNTPTMSFKPGTNLNGRKYRCHITDAAGNEVYSDAATLTVVSGRAITAQPQDDIANEEEGL